VELSLRAPVALMIGETTPAEEGRGGAAGGEELQLISANIVENANDDTKRLCGMSVATAASATWTCRSRQPLQRLRVSTVDADRADRAT